ncbi:FG-GAP repeat domain-containing protein [Mariniflexile sp. AS56]|uniref:FG-GAP repeat domain-containing protein n=1 Tax=Mariniflexile sp. AS56 TaxID=3063957 RepID=UPI0026ED2466|nr:VCBS repeat-containing protein [Mariniflexile sp. AS56]MDO7172950.1 VCBS repeat-containing protein [Mariniflexile sp. AS56]
MLKKILKYTGILILLLLVLVLGFFWRDSVSDKYDITIADNKIPQFEAITLDFKHQYNGDKSLPIAPSALIDINNDNIDEVFFGGGMFQEDAIFAYRDNKFVNISSEVNLPKKGNTLTTVGVVSADFDNNGFTDIILGREDGLTIYYNTNGKLTVKKINTPINEKSTPAGLTVGDIDKDGDLDIFMATYLKKELMEGQTIFEDYTYGSTSELLLNTGNENFVSITKEAGLDYVHNTFQGVLVDIDNDTWLDLVVVHDTGEARTYKNNGDLTYTMKPNPLTKKFAYPMGLAVGDYNNDGLVDFMFSNTGSTLPRALAKGDIKDASLFNEKWILFRNDGDFKFTDTAEETKIADYEFSWGCTFADMNNDGLQDLMVAENYVDLAPNKLFRLPSRFLVQKEDGTFAPTEEKSGVVNPYYAITSLVSDFNQDGYLDMIWVNIDTPSLAYINKGGSNNYLQVDLGESVQVQGAKVTVTTPTKTLTEWLVSGEGLASDQTALLQFGLGEDTKVTNVTIWLTNDMKISIDTPEINSILDLKSEVVKQVEVLETPEEAL